MLYHFAHAGHSHDEPSSTTQNASELTSTTNHTDETVAAVTTDQTAIYVGGAAIALIGFVAIAAGAVATRRKTKK